MSARRKLEVQALELQTERTCARKNVRRGRVKPGGKIQDGWVGLLVVNAWLLGRRAELGLGFLFPAEGQEAAVEANKPQKKGMSRACLDSMGFCCLENEETLL